MYVIVAILSFFCKAAAEKETLPRIVISPDTIIKGLTESMLLDCSIRNDDIPSVSTIFSLIIWHSKDQENDAKNFTEVAAVSTFEGLLTNSDIQHSQISGQVNNKGLTFVNITWPNPQEDMSGFYRCEVHGVSKMGKPLTFSNIKHVPIKMPSFDSAIVEILKLKEQLTFMKSRVDNAVKNTSYIFSEVNRTKDGLSVLNSNVLKMETNISKQLEVKYDPLLHNLKNQTMATKEELGFLKNKFDVSKNEFFIKSEYFNGRRYWLTKAATSFNPNFAMAFCGLFGGYLAEIDTQPEFNFVRNFVISRGQAFTHILLGGTDEGHEGRWVNRYSKTAVSSFWGKGEPNNYGRNEHCQTLQVHFAWYMNDMPCSFSSYGTQSYVGFMCEIPH